MYKCCFVCVCVYIKCGCVCVCQCFVDVVQSLLELSIATVWSKSVKTLNENIID